MNLSENPYYRQLNGEKKAGKSSLCTKKPPMFRIMSLSFYWMMGR